MTIAIDRATGEVVGQVLDETPQVSLDRDPDARKLYLILSAKGYSTIAASSVRLEVVR